MIEIAPRSGSAFIVHAGQKLLVRDPKGQQVADLVAYNRNDPREVISSGRSLDYASKLFLSTGDLMYSNRSNVLLEIVEDTVGRHDFLLTPCSRDTFRLIYGDKDPHQGCFGNLERALLPFGIMADSIPVAFNCFMNVVIDVTSGRMKVEAPLSKPGDHIAFQAAIDLIIGLTACSAPQSNNYAYKPIEYEIT